MKRPASGFLAILLGVFLLVIPAFAEDTFSFTLLEDGSGWELSSCTDPYVTTITIPAEHEGLPVKAIGNQAFLTCRNLKEFLVEEGQPVFYTDNGVLFTDDPVKTLIRFPNAWGETDAAYRLPEDTAAIASYAFSGNHSLTYLHIPKGVETLADYALADIGLQYSFNLMVYFEGSPKKIGSNLLQGQQRNVPFYAPSNSTALSYARKNAIPCEPIKPMKAQKKTVTEAEADLSDAEDPGLPDSPNIITVSVFPYLRYDSSLACTIDLTTWQKKAPDEIRIPFQKHWTEIIPDADGRTENGFPPATGLYGIGYTEEEITLRGYDAAGNITGVRRVSGDFSFSFPGAVELGESGGMNTHLSVIPYEPIILPEPGIFPLRPDLFLRGETGMPFRFFILQYTSPLFSQIFPQYMNVSIFRLQDAGDVYNGESEHYGLLAYFIGDPYLLDQTDQISLQFHQMKTLYENDEFTFRSSSAFSKVKEDYGIKLYEVLQQLKATMIGPYYPSDATVNHITISVDGNYPGSFDSKINFDQALSQYKKSDILTYAHEMVHAIDQSYESISAVSPSAWMEGRAEYISRKVCDAMKAPYNKYPKKYKWSFLSEEDREDFFRFFCNSTNRETSYPVGYYFCKYLTEQYGEEILGRITENLIAVKNYSFSIDNSAAFKQCVTSVTDPDVFQNFVRDVIR